MKVAILSKAGVWGGLEVHAVGLTQALIRRGHDAFILCLDQATRELYQLFGGDRVPLVQVNGSKPTEQRGCLDWLTAFRRITADACIFEKNTLHTGSLSLDIAARLQFRRFVTIQQLEPPPLPAWSRGRYLGDLIPGLGLWWYRMKWAGYWRSVVPQKTICVCQAVSDQLRTNYRFAPQKLVIVHNGIDPERFRADPVGRRKVRADWGLSNDALVFGSARRLAQDKGLDVAIEAFALLVGKFPGRETALVLVGEGPERAALERLARERQIAHKVIFSGFLPNPCLAYSGLDIFLMPSRREALSIALLEAMAAGCCPIASNVGGMPEILTDPSLGWLVPPDDPRALAQAMETALLMKPEERAQMQGRAREHVVAHFNAQTQFLKIAEIIEQ